MENFETEFERYRKAKKQVEEIKGFYIHLFSFVLGMGFMLYLNLKYSPKFLWIVWPLMGWSIGLFFHAAKAYNFFPFFSKDWEERKIKQFMEEENNNANKFE